MNYKILEEQGHKFYVKDENELSSETKQRMIEYARMAKDFMNRPMTGGPDAVVGNYQWHENFPYVKNLLSGITLNPNPKIADFGGGPGRMIKRFDALASVLDCIDISDYALEYLRQQYAGDSKFHMYSTTGIDLGNAPQDFYDLIYSTICMQHIPSRTIRRNIFRGMYNSLASGGWISVQMGFHPAYQAGQWSHDTNHATYDSDYWNASATNGHADCVINLNDLPMLAADLEDIFSDVFITRENVSEKYANLGGAYHAPYWCSDWIFLKGKKA